MEEAYTELYQEFLRLRSLCMRQAAMLHQLTTALQKQQGAAVSNRELDELTSIPVQCTQEILLHPHEKPVTAHNPAAQCGVDPLSRNAAIFSDLLAEDMSKLCMNATHQRKDGGKVEQKHLLTLDSSNPRQTRRPGGNSTLHPARVPVTVGLSLVGADHHQCGGVMMSDVALQSHVCDFCQAVFPGDTTTRGEFLRHLYTHVS
ncbi:uncharacterized protein zgc:113184 [Scomber scombrus]|uniref:Uncharacterized protein zgc:113184 n=1 Tax=Scomber scombrus TaxID=13677 RepID=A0AAV1NAD8_SCOSC|nr:uncharacterized protein zgc:113184 [Scomber scombrus]XP_062272127.1 uncharacterized protein zgc:113184 [Scomber scombrus]